MGVHVFNKLHGSTDYLFLNVNMLSSIQCIMKIPFDDFNHPMPEKKVFGGSDAMNGMIFGIMYGIMVMAMHGCILSEIQMNLYVYGSSYLTWKRKKVNCSYSFRFYISVFCVLLEENLNI